MESTINSLSERFNLSPDFLTELHNKIVDKENFTRAVRMFVDGLMPYDMATGQEPINVAELRHKVATDIWAFRKDKAAKIRAAMEQQRRIQEYYSGCKSIRHPKKPKGAFLTLFSSKTDTWLPLPILSRQRAAFTPRTMKLCRIGIGNHMNTLPGFAS